MKLGAILAGVLLLGATGQVLAGENDGEDYRPSRWQEVEATFPLPPSETTLKEFFVSAATTNRFYVDLASISVGSDGVVRYVLVAQTAEGGRNISFEGIRCESGQRRIYALGRSDGSWSAARNKEWVRIRDVTANRQHAALYSSYFCPLGVAVLSADEARDALKRGVHPMVKYW